MSTNEAAMAGSTASTSNPVIVLPVNSLTQPISYGPPKPARLPIELINAMPPAAATPLKKAVGRVQNSPNAANPPIAATMRAAMVRDKLPA